MKPPRLSLAICNMLSITPISTVIRAQNIFMVRQGTVLCLHGILYPTNTNPAAFAAGFSL